MSRIFVDEKNSNDTTLLVEWEVAPPPPANVSLEYLASFAPIPPASASASGGVVWTNASAWTSANEVSRR